LNFLVALAVSECLQQYVAPLDISALFFVEFNARFMLLHDFSSSVQIDLEILAKLFPQLYFRA
tara:strand:- start:73 stop:261 length:189 start_codon:yes stop_codon:yes gene_type:complete